MDNKPKQLKLNKDQAEEQGLIKIDVLSSRGLGQLWEIEQRPIEEYPYDEEVYKVFHGGYNIGITFGESPAMRKLFRVHKPKSINDIARLLGLVRPCAIKVTHILIKISGVQKHQIFDLLYMMMMVLK